MKTKKKKKMIILLSIISVIAIIGLCILGFMSSPRFGRTPRGDILKRIEASPNYRDGRFQNITPRIPRDRDNEKPFLVSIYEFFFKKVEGLEPSMTLPSKKTDIKQIDRNEDILVWLSHSSLYIQIDGVRFLFDPVLVTGSPVSFVNKAFPGTDVYNPDDIPDIDYLLISHDHFDHLDYQTVKRLKNRIGKVICGLGVGEHFRRWGFPDENIIEMDWNENITLEENIKLYVLPARHYSGRAKFGADNTLWISFFIEAPSFNIYNSGDTGYDIHFKEIGKNFPKIDLAIIENGQYGYDWRDIHLLPDDLVQVIKDLNPIRIFTTHNAKYRLARHTWKDPLEKISEASDRESFNLITPLIGELVYLKDLSQEFTKWWEDIK